MNILIKNGRIVDPSQEIDAIGDILIENGKVSKIGGKISDKDARIIDAEGKLVVPGLIDMHTHLREPGREDKETVATGLRAAIKGGFTTVCAMPNTDPPCDSQAHVKFLLERARSAGTANLLPIGTMTKRREGKEMSEMRELKEAGAIAVSDDGDSVANAMLMRRALEYASMVGLLVISHAEDKVLAGGGVMNEGFFSTKLGLDPMPREAESTIVERDIRLAELAGARVHIAHVSVKESVDIIRQAKKNGVKVTAETTPHHIALEDKEVVTYDTNMKVNPPLRSAEDRKALKQGLADGTIDVIATDHAPHLASEKEMEFDYAPFGMIGLETALSIAAMELLDTKILDWSGIIRKMSQAPARILGYARGTLAPGASADVTVIDPEKKWIYEEKDIVSLSHNSPFIGREMKARVTDVVVGGEIILSSGKFI